MTLFDTDVLIWMQRGNEKALSALSKTDDICISAQTYMELLQCAENKRQHTVIKDFLADFDISIIPFTENISHRASVYIEEYSLTHGIRAGDAIIAATAAENNLRLVSGNTKHFRAIKDLKFTVFKP